MSQHSTAAEALEPTKPQDPERLPMKKVITLGWVLPGYAADPTPPVLESVEVTERIGELVPEDALFQDSSGQPVQLKQWLHRGQPLLLSLNYYRCPMLCSLVLRGMVNGLR